MAMLPVGVALSPAQPVGMGTNYPKVSERTTEQYLKSAQCLPHCHDHSQVPDNFYVDTVTYCPINMGRASILTLIAFVSAALGQAHPDAIVAKPLPDGCASYPGYDPETDIAGPWTLTVGTNAENPSIRGFGNRDTYSASFNPRTDPKPSLRWGHVSGTGYLKFQALAM